MFLELVNVDLAQKNTSETLFDIMKEVSKFVGWWGHGSYYFLDLCQRFWWWIGHNYNVTLAIYLVGKIVKQLKNSRVFFVFVFLMTYPV